MTRQTFYTDGSCLNLGKTWGPGAAAYINATTGKFRVEFFAETNHAQMEIAAALLAVESLPLDHRGYVEIRTDSTDLLRWVKAGYQFIDEGFGPKIHVITGGPVCELLKAAILARSQAEIGFVYVEGHATSAWNNAVHRLANRAANRKPLLLPLIPQPSKPKAKLHPKGLRPVNRTLADALAAARKQSLDKT